MFLDELYKITGLPYPETFNEYKLVNIAGKAIFIQNYIKLISYSKEEIVLKVKNNELIISGKELTISELSNKNILIKGNIFKSYLTKEIKNEKK